MPTGNLSSSLLCRLQAHFAKAVDHCAHAAEVAAANDEQTLGFTLDLYARFVEAEKVRRFHS